MKTHGPLCVEGFVEPMFQENGYLVWLQDGPEAWILDPGFDPHAELMLAALRRRKLTPTAVLVTHAHPDHIAGIPALREAYPNLALVVSQAEQHMLGDPEANLSAAMGMNVVVPAATRLVAPGEALTFGTVMWRVLDVSGHSPGGLAYYCPEAGVVFTGDALFADSIGRTDFPGGSLPRLVRNIRSHLFTLPENTVVYSGHGPPTTIGQERATNPWVREQAAS